MRRAQALAAQYEELAREFAALRPQLIPEVRHALARHGPASTGRVSYCDRSHYHLFPYLYALMMRRARHLLATVPQ
jgi:hypothetical protein